MKIPGGEDTVFICGMVLSIVLWTVGTGGIGYEIGKHVADLWWQENTFKTRGWPPALHSNEIICWQNRNNSVAVCGYLDPHDTFVQFAIEPKCLDVRGSVVPCSSPGTLGGNK
jgi:hypothetical protein